MEMAKGCPGPGTHLLATTPGVLGVKEWEDLPAALEQAAADPSALAATQREMLRALEERRTTTRATLLRTVAAMRESVATASAWRPRTTCVSTPLTEAQIAHYYKELGEYWRQPQPFVDTREHPTIADHPEQVLERLEGQPVPEHWVAGRAGDVVTGLLNATDLRERCMSVGCSPPLVADFTCAPTAESV